LVPQEVQEEGEVVKDNVVKDTHADHVEDNHADQVDDTHADHLEDAHLSDGNVVELACSQIVDTLVQW